MHRQLGLILPIPRNLKGQWTYDKEACEKARKPVGEFNHFEIEVDGGNMVIKLNGVVVSTVRNCELTEGLAKHPHPGEIAFLPQVVRRGGRWRIGATTPGGRLARRQDWPTPERGVLT